MNIALVIAGGSGKRMGQDIPKQFISVYDKPILVYTLENFQKHPLVDEIVIVSIEGWIDVVKAYTVQFGLTKVKSVIAGGDTVQESIRNGVFSLEERVREDDIIIIHDGIRPMIEDEIVTDVIRIAGVNGNGVTATDYNEQIFVMNEDRQTTERFIPRETIKRVATPQAYQFGLLDRSYHRAFEEKIGIYGSSYTNNMMIDLGETLYFAMGSDRNIKLTTKDDLQLFKAYLKVKSGR